MADTGDIAVRVDRLLHDAEHADSGAMMAKIMRDLVAERKFMEKKAALLAEAERLDPTHSTYAWQEAEDA